MVGIGAGFNATPITLSLFHQLSWCGLTRPRSREDLLSPEVVVSRTPPSVGLRKARSTDHPHGIIERGVDLAKIATGFALRGSKARLRLSRLTTGRKKRASGFLPVLLFLANNIAKTLRTATYVTR